MFRMIADKAVDIITVHNLDPGATYRYVSPSMKKFTGWDPKELIGRSPYELIYKVSNEGGVWQQRTGVCVGIYVWVSVPCLRSLFFLSNCSS